MIIIFIMFDYIIIYFIISQNKEDYISALNKKIYNGTIYDSVAVMKMIDVIYKSDANWKKKFFKK